MKQKEESEIKYMRIKKYENKWMVWKHITNIFNLAVTQQYFGAFQKPQTQYSGPEYIHYILWVNKYKMKNKNEK